MKVDIKKVTRQNFDVLRIGDVVFYDDGLWMVRDICFTILHNHKSLELVRFNGYMDETEEIKKEDL